MGGMLGLAHLGGTTMGLCFPFGSLLASSRRRCYKDEDISISHDPGASSVNEFDGRQETDLLLPTVPYTSAS